MINKCLFPAAGYGTRFLPATKSVPKEMLPIVNKPILQYGVEEALASGIKNMAIVTGRGKRAIEDHFDKAFELEAQLKETSKDHYLKEINEITEEAIFTYVRQKKMLGLGHAILSAKPLIGNEPFAVILADDLCFSEEKEVTAQLIEIYNKHKCSIIAIEEVPTDQIHNYGIIHGSLIKNSHDIYEVNNMVEKPKISSSNLAIIGRYILTPDIFKILKTITPDINGEIQITDALMSQANKGRVLAYKFKGKRFDCGSLNGFIKATNFFAKKLGF